MKNKIEKKSLGAGLIQAMEEALEHSRGKRKARTRTVELPKEVKGYSKAQVVKLRKQIIQGSQPVMAAYVNVSPYTIKSWEQAQKGPSGSASLLLSLFEKYPRLMKALRHQMIPPEEAERFVQRCIGKEGLRKIEPESQK